MNNHIDDTIKAFYREISPKNLGEPQILGDPPVLDSRNRCTFCGNHAGFHRLSDTFAYDATRQLREAHRKDFGPNGIYSDEARCL